jgi:hypothetical protein
VPAAARIRAAAGCWFDVRAFSLRDIHETGTDESPIIVFYGWAPGRRSARQLFGSDPFFCFSLRAKALTNKGKMPQGRTSFPYIQAGATDRSTAVRPARGLAARPPIICCVQQCPPDPKIGRCAPAPGPRAPANIPKPKP